MARRCHFRGSSGEHFLDEVIIEQELKDVLVRNVVVWGTFPGGGNGKQKALGWKKVQCVNNTDEHGCGWQAVEMGTLDHLGLLLRNGKPLGDFGYRADKGKPISWLLYFT